MLVWGRVSKKLHPLFWFLKPIWKRYCFTVKYASIMFSFLGVFLAVTFVSMDGSISAYLNVWNVTHSEVMSQTTSFLLSTDPCQKNSKKKMCLLQCQRREALTSCRDADIFFFFFFAVYNISYRKWTISEAETSVIHLFMSIWFFYNHVVISAYRKERVEQVQTTIAAQPLQ